MHISTTPSPEASILGAEVAILNLGGKGGFRDALGTLDIQTYQRKLMTRINQKDLLDHGPSDDEHAAHGIVF